MSSPPAPHFDVNVIDHSEHGQLDFGDNPFALPQDQYRFDLKQWLAFIHEVRAKLSYLQVYALEEGPQIPQNQKKSLYSTSPNSTNKTRPFSVPNLRESEYAQPDYSAAHNNNANGEHYGQQYYTNQPQVDHHTEQPKSWSQTVRPNTRLSTLRGGEFELGSSRRAINPYRNLTESAGPASTPSLALPKRRLETSYQYIPGGMHPGQQMTPVTPSVAPSAMPYGTHVTSSVAPSVTPYGTHVTPSLAPSALPYSTQVAPSTAGTQLGSVTAPAPKAPDMFGPLPPRSATESTPKVALSPGMPKRRAEPGTNYQLIPTSNSAQFRASQQMTPVTPSVVQYDSSPFQSQQMTPVTSNVAPYGHSPQSQPNSLTPVTPSVAPTAGNSKRAAVVYSTSK